MNKGGGSFPSDTITAKDNRTEDNRNRKEEDQLADD
jgi:hypothetical protein